MSSIRESCRSIEELDLGGNKLVDLIEVYKILQCTPNLRFLNLSENDLSRTSPVAMANSTMNCPATSSIYSPNSAPLQQVNSNQSTASSSFNNHATPYAPPIVPGASSYTVTNNIQPQNSHANNWLNTNSTSTLNSQRTCLAPINQNQNSHSHSIGSRRHSSLGQPSTSSALVASTSTKNHYQRTLHRQAGVSRVAEARLLAATAAVAQSKKTSSTVASKLTNSAATAHKRSNHRNESSQSKTSATQQDTNLASLKTGHLNKSKRCLASATSTMHLVRSLSSLSAKDARTVSSSLGRLSVHRSNVCRNKVEKTAAMGVKKCQSAEQRNRRSSLSSDPTSFQYTEVDGTKVVENTQSSLDMSQTSSLESKFNQSTKLTTSVSSGKLYVEPIVETEDIDMSDQQPQTGTLSKQQIATPSVSQTISASTNASSSSQLASTTNPKAQYNFKTSQVTSYTFGGAINHSGSGQSTNFRRTFKSIKGLALNNTGCQWRIVCSILSRMPNLEELHLSLNNYERIDLDPNEFKHYSLKRLYLCNNPKLTNWKELDKLLNAFPSLEALSIADCNISQIPENLGRSREWRKLCGLNINGWPIKEWPVIERLNQLPSLVDLKCRNLEVLSTIDEPRHHLIARLPKLQRLNGSEIEEREHAEKAFLRFYMTNSHLERPARFHELIQIHGEVGPIDVDVDLSPPSHAHVRVIYLNRSHYRKDNEDDILMSEDFLIKLMETVEPNNIVVQSNNSDSSLQENMDIGESSSAVSNAKEPLRLFKDEGQEVIAIDIDLRQSVRKFKSTLASLFGLVNQDLIIYYIDHEMVGLMGPEEIKHNQKKLWNYNVQDGDQFIVEER